MELLERESALADLERAAALAAGGEGQIVVLEGPAGIGKSAVVDAFLADRGETVMAGACDDLSIPQVLGPFEDVVRDYPVLEAALDEGLVAFRRSLLDALGSEPTIIAIEDIHWADEATIDLLSYLARRLAGLPVVIIATVRTELAIDHAATRFLASIPLGLGTRVALTELSLAAVARLAADSALDADDIYSLTGGNPFLVRELLAWGEPVPATVADSVSARIASLPDPAGAVAALLSVIPGQAGWDLVDHLPTTAEALADLELAGVVTSAPEGISFRHELVRRAVAERLSATETRHLNLEVLRALLDLSASHSRIAHHAAEAGDVDALLSHGRAAIDEAVAAGAHPQALAHVENLLPFADHLPPESEAELWYVAAIEYRGNDDLESASAAIWKAIGLWEGLDNPTGLATGLGQAATFAWEQSRAAECTRLRQRAISILEPFGPSRELAEAYIVHGQDLSLTSHLTEALDWIERAIRSTDDEDVVGRALGAREPIRVMLGEGDAARSDGDKAIEILTRHDDHAHLTLVYTNRIAAAINALELENVEDDIQAARSFGEDLDYARFSTALSMQTGRLQLLRGRWDLAREASDFALQRIPSGVSRSTSLVVRALLRGRGGDRAAVEVLGDAIDLVAGTKDIQRMRGACAAAAEFTWLGLMDDVDLVRAGYELAGPSGFLRGYSELALWLRRLGEVAPHEGPAPEPHALELEGDHAAAAEAWERKGVPYQRGLTMAFSGDAALMRASLDIFDELGASMSRDRVSQMLRDLGVPVGRRRAASTLANPHGLTSRQLEVLELLAEDLTDREIAERLYISPKTVGHHVSAILTKLGVESRREAARHLPE